MIGCGEGVVYLTSPGSPLPRLGKRELILVLFVRLFDLRLFGFVCFLFVLVSGKGCGLWLWYSLDFSLTFFYSLARPAILVAGKGRGEFCILFLHFIPVLFPVPLFHLLYYLFYLFSSFLWETTQNKPNTIKSPCLNVQNLVYIQFSLKINDRFIGDKMYFLLMYSIYIPLYIAARGQTGAWKVLIFYDRPPRRHCMLRHVWLTKQAARCFSGRAAGNFWEWLGFGEHQRSKTSLCHLGNHVMPGNQGPFVQSIIHLTSSLMVKMFTSSKYHLIHRYVCWTKMWVAKAIHIFSTKILAYMPFKF